MRLAWRFRAQPETPKLAYEPEATIEVDVPDEHYGYIQAMRAVVQDESKDILTRKRALNELHVYFEAIRYGFDVSFVEVFKPTKVVEVEPVKVEVKRRNEPNTAQLSFG